MFMWGFETVAGAKYSFFDTLQPLAMSTSCTGRSAPALGIYIPRQGCNSQIWKKVPRKTWKLEYRNSGFHHVGCFGATQRGSRYQIIEDLGPKSHNNHGL